MFSYGLKLFSTNANYAAEAVRLYKENIYDYIELYSEPNSYKKFIQLWKNLEIPYVIHAPHFRNGLNLAKAGHAESNKILLREAQAFADALSAETIIVHPGIAGDINETSRQLNNINDCRIIIENKPFYALDDGLVCNGSSPEEIKKIIEETGSGFCFDIGHAIYSANARKVDPWKYINMFLDIKPKMLHLADGDFNSVYDKHDHFGNGSFNLKEIINYIPDRARITLETEKKYTDNLKDFEQDALYLNMLVNIL